MEHRPGFARRAGGVAVAFALVAAVFLVGIWIGGHPRQSGIDRLPSGVRDTLVDEKRTAIGTQVLSILEQDYYKPIDPAVRAKAEDASVAELVKRLGDPYTQYLTPDEYRRFLNARAGTYVGVGIEWHPEGDGGRVLRVVPGGPADRAGMRPRDLIVEVDGRPVTRASDYAAMGTVKGEEGTKVTLGVVRGADRRDFTMTRAEIKEMVVDSRVETVGGKKVGYVRLDRFTTGSADALAEEVRALREKDVSGLVLDLRGDPGGLVDEAVDVAGVFLPTGTAVVTSKPRSGSAETLTTDEAPVDAALPLVVLLDRDSASASEIVAGALRDAGRATLVGQRTFGKALIQTTRSLANGGAIKYTVASYLTPKGFDLGTRGLPPDVPAVDDPATPADEALDRAARSVLSR